MPLPAGKRHARRQYFDLLKSAVMSLRAGALMPRKEWPRRLQMFYKDMT